MIVVVTNAYNVPAVRVTGYACKTNLPSNTAFRASGNPQGMFVAEHVAERIADFLGKDVEEISRLNLVDEGQVPFYNQTLKLCTVRRCWDECLVLSEYTRRRMEVQDFNRYGLPNLST